MGSSRFGLRNAMARTALGACTAVWMLGCEESPPDEPVRDWAASEGWAMVLLPDTQCYSMYYPHIMVNQGEWIAEMAESLDIRLVAHLGDITETNVPSEWEAALHSYGPLSGVVPVLLPPGNHDLGPNGAGTERSSGLGHYLPTAMRAGEMTFGGAYEEDGWNTYYFLNGDLHDFLVIGLEFGPRDAVLDWARQVALQYPERMLIVVTHAYLWADGSRYDHRLPAGTQNFNPHAYGVAHNGGVNDGEQIWQKLLSPLPQARLVLSGHVPDSFAHSSDVGMHGQRVEQLLADWQRGTRCDPLNEDGRGYMQVLEVRETIEEVVIDVVTYSPWEDRVRSEHSAQLRLAAL